ncbi:MAG: NAD(P)/FAD-dependent oxidoreductase, partial [Pseudomonadales bacterium]
FQAYLRLFRRRSGELACGCQVDSLKFESGRWQLQCGEKQFHAPIVVNAAGPWADTIADLAGIGGLGITPMRRTAVLIDPPVDVNIGNWPMVVDIDEQLYFKPDAGQLLISPADETPSVACDARPEELDVAIAVDRFKKMTGMEVRRINHRWAGLRSFASDRNFVLGFDPRATGFFWLAGQGGYGVQTAPAVANLATALITRTPLTSEFTALSTLSDILAPQRLLSQ